LLHEHRSRSEELDLGASGFAPNVSDRAASLACDSWRQRQDAPSRFKYASTQHAMVTVAAFSAA